MKSGLNAFAGLGDVLGNGFDVSLTSEAVDLPALDLDLIDVVEQERHEFEDDDNSLQELGASMQSGRQWQQILVRPIDGRDKPYELVAGERRYRAARLVGMQALRAFCVPLTDEEAADARFAENIQRKNLTLLEEARRLKKDVDELGVEATLAKHQKSRAWVSKRLQMLDLPDHARRLVTEHISADIEVINQVRQIEKIDPTTAESLVADLKATRGKERARDQVAKVKNEVKPSARKSKSYIDPAGARRTNTEGGLAAPIDRSIEQPSTVQRFGVRVVERTAIEPTPDDDERHAASTPLPAVLVRIYDEISEGAAEPGAILAGLADNDREDAESRLYELYQAGLHSKNAGSVVVQGLRRGVFAGCGAESFALAAYVCGIDGDDFSLLNIFGSARD